MRSLKHLSSLCLVLLLPFTQPSLAQDASASAAEAVDAAGENADSTVVYTADFFAQYNPVTANDMLDRIPGISLGGGGPGGGGGDRGLGTGGAG